MPKESCSVWGMAPYGFRFSSKHVSESMDEEKLVSLFRIYWRRHAWQRNPLQGATLAKGIPQLLQANPLKGWQNTDCYDQNICVTCFYYDNTATHFCCILGMQKWRCICLLVVTGGHFIQADCTVGENTIFLGRDDHVGCASLCKPFLLGRRTALAILLSLCCKKRR